MTVTTRPTSSPCLTLVASAVGATVGSVGTADNAIGTAANGAIIDSSGTFYVIAGGHAFGIPNLAQLAVVQAGDTVYAAGWYGPLGLGPRQLSRTGR